MNERYNFLLPVIKTLLVVLFGPTVTALLGYDKTKGFWTVLRIWVGGFCFGCISYIVCEMNGLRSGTTTLICAVSSSFASTLWPVLGRYVNKAFIKKMDSYIGDTKS